MINNLFAKCLVAAVGALLSGYGVSSVPGTVRMKMVLTDTTKEAYIPAKVYRVPEGNDYNNPESEFSNQRKAETDNIIVFWSKEFGADPAANPDASG